MNYLRQLVDLPLETESKVDTKNSRSFKSNQIRKAVKQHSLKNVIKHVKAVLREEE